MFWLKKISIDKSFWFYSRLRLMFYKKFKKEMYYTNHVNVERILLTRENLQQICRLLLLNSFIISDSKLTQTMQSLCHDCSTLFDSLMSRSEKKDDQDEAYLSIIDDQTHSKVTVIDRLQIYHCKWILKLSIWFLKLFKTNRKNLRKTYETDYQMSEILHFDQKSISWCKKLSFTDT